jgi:hypothetical protein
LCEDACASERALANRLRAVVQAGEAALAGAVDRSAPRAVTATVRRMPGV